MAISRILSWMIIYLSSAFAEPPDNRESAVKDRRYSRRDATIPEDLCRTGYPPSVLSCTAWGFSCRAYYSARGELLPRLFTLACSRQEAGSFPTVVVCKEPAVSFL